MELRLAPGAKNIPQTVIRRHSRYHVYYFFAIDTICCENSSYLKVRCSHNVRALNSSSVCPPLTPPHSFLSSAIPHLVSSSRLMFCPECRTNCQDGWKFCPSCGQDMTSVSSSLENEGEREAVREAVKEASRDPGDRAGPPSLGDQRRGSAGVTGYPRVAETKDRIVQDR